MSVAPSQGHRRSIRLPGYDYASPGAYFVTVCIHGGECALGEVVDGEMQLSEYGRVVDGFWAEVAEHFPGISVDAHVTMPNHIHAVLWIHDQDAETAPLQQPMNGRGGVAPPSVTPQDAENPQSVEPQGAETQGAETAPLQQPMNGRGGVAPPSAWAGKQPALGQIVAYFKYETTKQINLVRQTPSVRFWQRNYWEHIIRHDESLTRIRAYIVNNPAHWEQDQLHPLSPPNSFNQWRAGSE